MAFSSTEKMSDEDLDAMRKLREEMRKRSRANAESILTLAGFSIVHAWELANQYWPDSPEYDDVREPWWLFLTDIGSIVIGRRKHVLNIDWSACTARGIVTQDDVTKWESGVHAYSPASAVAYLTKLRVLAKASGETSALAKGGE